jgi:CubicO group peptidase (beta-lactamase class C family)
MTVSQPTAEFHTAIELLDEQLALEQTARNLGSLSAVVVHNQKIAWTRSYGSANLEAQIPASPHTMYRLNSITKLFTATMLLQLRDAGKLHLDDLLATYLPRFSIRSPFSNVRPPTLRQVASHTAGLPNMPPLDEFRDPAAMMEAITNGTFVFPSIDVVLDSLHAAELVASPMTSINYSNLGFALLGHALERIADQPYQEYVKEHILQPLGMTNSGFAVTPTTTAQDGANNRFATGYISMMPPVVAPSVAMNAFVPAGQLAVSASDMARFVALQFGDELARDVHVLSNSTLREMHAPVFLAPDGQHGVAIGWFLHRLANHVVISHGGAGHDGIAVIGVAPHYHVGVGLFTNVGAVSVDPGSIQRLTMDVLELLLPQPVMTRNTG